MFRNIKTENKREFYRPKPYDFPKGITPVLREYNFPRIERIEVEEDRGERMQIE
jgi:hypothetical protein